MVRKIVISGFTDTRRSVLAQQCQAAGLNVMPPSAKRFDYFCIGHGYAPSALSRALEAGAALVNEADLLYLLEREELPATSSSVWPSSSLHVDGYGQSLEASNTPPASTHPKAKVRVSGVNMDLRFDYRKADGSQSTRRLTRCAEEGHYVTGFDLDAGQERTFRKDRITQYHDGCASLLRAPYEGPPPKLVRQVAQDARPQILFTGFARAQRAMLEAKADVHGVRVMQTVTTGLAFLCIGPNAGPAKVEKARAQGVYIVTELQLHPLLETGELPDDLMETVC